MPGIDNIKMYYEKSRRLVISEFIQDHAIKKEINGRRENKR
jgi:hypothetical protein